MKAMLVRGALLVGAFVLVTSGTARSASAQITGCCIGPVCSNKTARSCTASGGTALNSTCTSSQDPRCAGGGGGGDCAGLSGAAAGLCRAYCNGLKCQDGHPGRACDALRDNWRKATGLPILPCDPVCCECPDGARQCASARRCHRAGCQVVDGCVNGQCPEPVCCQCAGGCTLATPRQCWRQGCTAAAGAMCTTAGVCERPCGPTGFHQCGGVCPNPGEVCQPDAADQGCVCVSDCPCGATCTDPATGASGLCKQTDPTTQACTCLVTPPPPDCPCGAPCDAGGAPGVCVQTIPGTDICTCAIIVEPPDCPCGTSCQINGALGVCRPTDPTNPNDCSCVLQ